MAEGTSSTSTVDELSETDIPGTILTEPLESATVVLGERRPGIYIYEG